MNNFDEVSKPTPMKYVEFILSPQSLARVYPACRRTLKFDLLLTEDKKTRTVKQIALNVPIPKHVFLYMPHVSVVLSLLFFRQPPLPVIPALLPNCSNGTTCLGNNRPQNIDEAISMFWHSRFTENYYHPTSQITFFSPYLKLGNLDPRTLQILNLWSSSSNEEYESMLQNYQHTKFEDWMNSDVMKSGSLSSILKFAEQIQ